MAYDIDQQSNTTHIQIEWYGFHHSSDTIQYEVGLGSQPGDDNIKAFYDMGTDETVHIFSGLALHPFQVMIL